MEAINIATGPDHPHRDGPSSDVYFKQFVTMMEVTDAHILKTKIKVKISPLSCITSFQQ